MKQKSETDKFVKGLVIGGVVGAALYLFASSKKGEEWQEDINDVYHDLSKKAVKATKKLRESGEDLYEDYSKGLLKKAHHISTPPKNVLIGSIAGGLLGIAAVYFLSNSRPESKFLASSESWVKKAKSVLDTIDSAIAKEEDSEPEKNTIVDDALQLATLGIRLYNNYKERV